MGAVSSRPVSSAKHEAGPRYEVMFFLEAADARMEAFRARWELLGEAVAIDGEEGLWNCHIHTDDVGAAIEAAIEAGRPRRIRVRDLRDEAGELEADLESGGFSPLPAVLGAGIGVVSVAEGAGLVERFRQLGVQQLVPAGKGGPSLEDLLAAVEDAASGVVVILPNHARTVPVAEQINALTTKTVAVVPTRSIAQGLAAMMGYVTDTEDLDGLLEDMAAAAGAVEFGEVTRATRNASVDGWQVAAGDWLGVADGRVVVVDPDRFSALRGLAAVLVPASPASGPAREGGEGGARPAGLGPSQAARLTVYSGEGAHPADLKALEAWVAETHPGVAVAATEGGQRALPYLLVVE